MNDDFKSVAHNFAKALAESRFIDAHSFLVPELLDEWNPENLEFEMKDMLEYAKPNADIKNIEVIETLDEWPDKQPDDIGWVYVALSGVSFSEAVSVVVSMNNSSIKIREIEWGRP